LGFPHAVSTVRHVPADFGRLLALCCPTRGAPAAENLFLRKPLVVFQERTGKPHRAADATRFLMAEVRIDRPISARSQTGFVAASSLHRLDRSHDYPPISIQPQMKNGL
jgi:hypothetical protein